MNYTDLQNRVIQMVTLPTGATETNLVTVLPAAIDYAENRLCRDLDFLALGQTVSFSAAAQTVALTTSPAFVVVERVETGSGAPLTRQSCSYIYAVWSGAANGVPVDYAMIDSQTMLLGPYGSGTINVSGTYRPTQLSTTNATNWLSLNVPDMYLAAAMVLVAEWINSRGMPDADMEMPSRWDAQYKQLFSTAFPEEFRRKSQSQGWTAQLPSPLASPRT